MKGRYLWIFFLGVCLGVHPVSAQEFLVAEFEPQIPVFQPSYTWGDFLVGQSCITDFNQLQNLPFLSEKQTQLKEKMQTYCVGQITVWDTLSTFFHQNKKALLIEKTLKENDSLLGYVKALPYYLFDIHNIKPMGTGLLVQLDKIQNALKNKDPEQIVFLMQDLSPNEQLFFMSLFNEASSLIDFKKLLSESEEKQ